MNNRIKTLVSLLLCLCLGMQIQLPVYALAADKADRKENVLTVSSAEEFLEFAENCRLDSFSAELTVVLECDLDLSGYEFVSIPIFSGTLEGGGNTISGVEIKTNGSVQGLFRYLRSSAVVRDLAVEGEITPGGSHNNIGGIAGINAGLIENCSFSGNISGAESVGGLVGVNELTGIIDSCSASGDIHGDHFVGGIAGSNRGVLRSCRNSAQINASAAQNSVDLTDVTVSSVTGSESAGTATDIGGITGTSSGVIRECVNDGVVGYPHIGYNVGGISGSQIGYITACENNGQVFGRKEVGGIVGQMEPSAMLSYEPDTLQILHGQLTAMSNLIDSTAAIAQNSSSQFSSQAGQLQGQLNTALDAMGQLNPGNGGVPDSDSTTAALNNLSSAMTTINGTVDGMTAAGQDSVEALTQKLGALLNQINTISGTIGGAAEGLGGSIADVSDQDTETDTTGKVESCFNTGSIDGDINVGGIAGAMSMENDLDPEDDLLTSGSSSLNFDVEARVVILDCENSGRVTAKRQNAGGVAGWMALGLVRRSINTGAVEAPAAKYIGGIAGQSGGYIRECSAKCLLDGGSYVGGIAGQVSDTVTDCLSMVVVRNCTEKCGAILGYGSHIAEGRENVPVQNNFYLAVDEDLGGVDGISYSAAAQSMEREQFLALENLPEMFKTVKVSFVSEDGSQTVISLVPGEALDRASVPEIPEKAGWTGRWDGLEQLDLSSVNFDATLTMVYDPLESTVQSSQIGGDGRPVLLAVGTFTAEEVLTIREITGMDPIGEKTQFVSGCEFSLANNGEVSQLRYRLPEGVESEKVQLSLRDASGEWRTAYFTADGSYIAFPVDEGDSAFRLDSLPEDHRLEIIAAAASAILLVPAAIVIARRRKERKADNTSDNPR